MNIYKNTQDDDDGEGGGLGDDDGEGGGLGDDDDGEGGGLEDDDGGGGVLKGKDGKGFSAWITASQHGYRLRTWISAPNLAFRKFLTCLSMAFSLLLCWGTCHVYV